ncbi:MAG: thioredoxin family protein [Desulfomonilaceae bacterium]|nr:thioredoxin family protein [Desulfomonilaceae bacterium]
MIATSVPRQKGSRPAAAALAVLTALLFWWMITDAHAGNKRNTVRLVFFSSKTCPKCDDVKQLIDVLKRRYPVKVKVFDIDVRAHYDLMERLEAIHSTEKFGVPMILVGETILIGEDRISAGLEKTVKRLAGSGGAPLPYLGPVEDAKPAAPRSADRTSRTNPAPCDCEKQARPPTLGEDWEAIKRFVERWF